MLDDKKSPEDLRGYDATELRQIADELRSETISRSPLRVGISGPASSN